MGIWEWIGSTANSVKENAPDTIKSGCQATYSYSSAAVKGAADQWMPDEETRSKMGLYTTKFAKNAGLYAVKEGYKIIPGGSAISKILSDTMNDVKQEKLIDQKLKVLEDKLKNSNAGPKTGDPAGILAVSCAKPAPSDIHYPGSETPQDVIKVFMMKDFMGNRLLSDLMITKKKGRNPKEEAIDHC